MSTWIEQQMDERNLRVCEPAGEHTITPHHHKRLNSGEFESDPIHYPEDKAGPDSECDACRLDAPLYTTEGLIADEWWGSLSADERVALCNREHERKTKRRDALDRLAADIDDDTPPDEVPEPTRGKPMPPIRNPHFGLGEPICKCWHTVSVHADARLDKGWQGDACRVRSASAQCPCQKFEERA